MAGVFRTQKSFLQTNAWQHQNLNALRYNTSQAGSVVPWMDGTTRVAVNLIDFGGYMGPGGGKKGKGVGPLPVGGTNSPGGFKGGGGGKGKGGGKKGKSQQHFSVDVAFGICQGPVTIAPSSFVWSSAGVAGFMSAGLNAYSGADGQAADPVMAGLHAPPPIGYSGTCVVTGTPMDLGMSPVIPNLSFEPAGPNAGTGGPNHPQDANPSKVVARFLTAPRDGADFPLANLDPNIDTLYGDYCLALGMVISPLLTGQTQAQEWLSGLAKLTNTAIVWSGNLLKLIPHGDMPLSGNGVSWTPNLIPEYSLTDDDFLDWHAGQLGQAEENQDDPILLTRSNPADAINWLTIEYLDRANFYNSTTIPVFDQGAIDTYGRRTGDNLNGHTFCQADGAKISAQLQLQRLQYIRNTYKFRLGWQYGLLEPMDIVLLSGRCGDHYLDLQPVRLTAIDEDENGALTIEAEEIAVALPTCSQAQAAIPPPAPTIPLSLLPLAANPVEEILIEGPITATSIGTEAATLPADPKVLLAVTAGNAGPTVATISSNPALSWARRSAFAIGAANMEVWWADARGLAGATVTIVAHYAAAVSTPVIQLHVVSGPVAFSGGNPWDINGSLPIKATSNAATIAAPGFSTSSVNALPLAFLASPDLLVDPGVTGSDEAVPPVALPFSATTFLGQDHSSAISLTTARGASWLTPDSPPGAPPPGPYSQLTVMPFAILHGSTAVNPDGKSWMMIIDAIAGD